MTSRIFFSGIIVFLIIACMEYLALVSDYVLLILWWWDIPMHILGGVWAGLIAAWFLVYEGQRPTASECVGFALLSGIVIEILEYYAGLGGNPYMSYPVDTAKDIVMDCLGGYIAWRMLPLLKKS